jgi:DNA segregation ATPase FtsK/SpoIIIE-like protein
MTSDMIQTASYQKLRNELKSIRSGLEEVMELLSSDYESHAVGRAADSSDQVGFSFLDEIIKYDETPEDEQMLRRVLNLIIELGYASTIVLQHRLEINYRQAASIIAELERAQLIGPAHGFRPHKVLPAAYEMHEQLGAGSPDVEMVK